MSDNGPLVLTAKGLGITILNPDRDVIVTVDLGPWAEFVGRPVVFRLTSDEARQFAQGLRSKANEAEAGSRSD
jgi:hypothetical protein